MSVVTLPNLREVDALCDAHLLASRHCISGTRGWAAVVLKHLGDTQWVLDRTAAGIEADTRAEIAALEAEEAA